MSPQITKYRPNPNFWVQRCFLFAYCIFTSFSWCSAQISTQEIATKIIEIEKNLTSNVNFAHELALQTLNEAKLANDKVSQIRILNILVDCGNRMSKYAEGVEWGHQAIRINTPTLDSVLLGDTYRKLAVIYSFGLNLYDEALNYHLFALGVFEYNQNVEMLAASYGSISWLYARKNENLSEALKMAQMGINLAEQINNPQFLAYNFNSKGLVLQILGSIDSAIYYYNKSIVYAKMVGDKAVIGYNYNLLGDCYWLKKDVDAAFNAYEFGLAESKLQQIPKMQQHAYKGLANCYEIRGDVDNALLYLRKYEALKEEIQNDNIAQKVLYYRNQLEGERQNALISQLKFENEVSQTEKRLLFLISVLGSLLLVTVIGFMIFRNQQKRTANKMLTRMNADINTKNEELEKLNETKNKLFAIIGHDLRGPIGNLQGLLALYSSGYIEQDDLQHHIHKLGGSVSGLQILLENLFEWSQGQLQGFKINKGKIDLREIATSIHQSYFGIANEKNITLSLDFDQNIFVLADKHHLLLVVRNLVNNAIKYTNAGGKVTIHGNHLEDKGEIIISDTGIGIHKDRIKSLFSFRDKQSLEGTEGEKGSGFGLVLCREMVEANDGEIFVESTVNIGSRFILRFPSIEKRE